MIAHNNTQVNIIVRNYSCNPVWNEALSTEFSKRLIQLRGAKSRRDFASEIGVSEGAIRMYENGSWPSLEVALRIAENYNVSIDWLAGRDGLMLAPNQDSAHELSADTIMTIAKAGALLEAIASKSKRILIDPKDLSGQFTEMLSYSIQEDLTSEKMDNVIDFQVRKSEHR